jgi:hypothetical protein
MQNWHTWLFCYQCFKDLYSYLNKRKSRMCIGNGQENPRKIRFARKECREEKKTLYKRKYLNKTAGHGNLFAALPRGADVGSGGGEGGRAKI